MTITTRSRKNAGEMALLGSVVAPGLAHFGPILVHPGHVIAKFWPHLGHVWALLGHVLALVFLKRLCLDSAKHSLIGKANASRLGSSHHWLGTAASAARSAS